jgi:hypothetical protein
MPHLRKGSAAGAHLAKNHGQRFEAPSGSHFGLSDAVEVLVSTGAHSGCPLQLGLAIESLKSEFPHESRSSRELAKMLVKAATRAGATIEWDSGKDFDPLFKWHKR